MRLKNILNPIVIVESDVKVGNMYMVHGYPLLKGLFPNKYYKVDSIDGDNVSLKQVNRQGKETNFTNGVITHKLSSIQSSVQSVGRGDLNGLELTTEATTSDVIKDLDKVKNDLLKKVDILVAKKKKLYSNVDIESPMSADEKKLDKDIADLFSQINKLVLQKRSLKSESLTELTNNEKQIKNGNPNNVYYAFYKGKFAATYWSMNANDLFRIYWDEFKVRRRAGSQFKLNPEFIIVSKKDYDANPNHYAKLKPHVDAFWDKLQNESINENKMLRLRDLLSEAKFPIYHKTYTSAINSALEWAEKQGFEYDKEETADKIGMGPKKPSEGKTNKFSISLTKGGKEQKKMLHIQVYNMGTFKRNPDGSRTRSMWGGQNEYELNCYIG